MKDNTLPLTSIRLFYRLVANNKLLILCFLAFIPLISSAQISVGVDDPFHEYTNGDTIKFELLSEENGPAQYVIKQNRFLDTLKYGVTELVGGEPTIITYVPTEPGNYFCYLTQGDTTARGAGCYERCDLKAINPLTNDEFETFWTEFKEELDEIPMDVHYELDPELETPYTITYHLDMASLAGRRAYAYVTIPKKLGQFVGLVKFPAFGSSAVSRDVEMSQQIGAIVISVNIHDFPPEATPTQSQVYKPNIYLTDTVYYQWAVAAGMRAVDFLYMMPEFDGEHVGTYGISQGAGLAALYAGIDNRIDLLAGVNAILSQHNGLVYSKPSGFPWYVRAYLDTPLEANRILNAVKYYDVVNAMHRFDGPAYMVAGLLDEVTSTEATYTALNQKQGKLVHMHSLIGTHTSVPSVSWADKYSFIRRYFPTNPSWPWPPTDIGFEANAGSDQENNCLKAFLQGSIDANGTINPNNIPVHWEVISGPGHVSFADSTMHSTVAEFSDPGTYRLRFVGIESSHLASDSWYYTIEDDVEISVCPDNKCFDISFDDPATDGSMVCDGAGGTVELFSWLADNGGASISSVLDVTWSNNFEALANVCVPTEVEFTATNVCGTAVSSTAYFTLENDTPPAFSAQAVDKTVICDGTGNTTELDAWLESHGDASATSLCGGVSWTNDFTTMEGLSVTVDFVATNDCGISDTTTATFVIDDSAPTFLDEAEDNTVVCNTISNMAAVELWLEEHGGATTDLEYVTWTNDFVALEDVCTPTTVTFTATNVCGMSSTTSANFTVVDNTAPLIEQPAMDEMVACDGMGNMTELDAWLADNGGAMASGNCSDFIWTNDFVSLEGNSVDVVFTATNDCGIASTTTATFSIDNAAPVFSAQAVDYVAVCDGAGNLEELNTWLSIHGGATVSDETGLTWSNDFTIPNDNCTPTTVVFELTNECGLSVTTTADFIIEDSTPPEIQVEATNKMVTCDGSGNTEELAAWLANHGGATATETCSDVAWSNNFTELIDGSTSVVFTATNGCGLSATTVATFSINFIAPTFSAQAADYVAECDGEGNQTELNAWLDSHGGAAVDESGIAWSNNFTELNDGCGQTEVVFMATNECGVSVTSTAVFVIEDNSAPVLITEAIDQLVPCDGTDNTAVLEAWLANNGGATASEVCSDIVWTNNFTDLDGGMAEVVFVATNGCGLAVSTTATFGIDDVAPTILTQAADYVAICGTENENELNAWLETHGGATVADEESVTWSNNFESLSEVCTSTTVVFTATNDCGIPVSSSATFMIEDNTPPVLVSSADDREVACGGDVDVELANWLAINGGASASDDCSDVIWTNDYVSFDGNSVDVTFSATNGCGLITSTGATFSVENVAPVISQEAVNYTAVCDGNGNEEELNTWLNMQGGAISNQPDIVWTNDFTELLGLCTPTAVVFTATNVCGSSVTSAATFTIEDNEPPELSALVSDIEIYCNSQGDYPEVDTWLVENGAAKATDECSEVIWTNDFSGIDCNETTIVVLFTASDACGNAVTTTGKIILQPDAVGVVEENQPILYQNRPNPYRDKTIIPFSLPSPSYVVFSIFDLLGHELMKIKGHYGQGENEVVFDTKGILSRGTYFYQIEVDGYRAIKKMVLID